MKRFAAALMCFILCIGCLAVPALARELVAVGQVVGLELRDGTVTVAAFDEELGAAAQAAGLEAGDRILQINGKAITCAEDVRKALETSKGMVTLEILRGGKQHRISWAPAITADGPKLGLYLRQGVNGIGTVTWYDPATGEFATLGHGVSNPAGQLLHLASGNAYKSRVAAVRKGKAGEPGQLMGCVESPEPIGTLKVNCARGVFGVSKVAWEGRTVQTASWEEIKTGKATILSTVSSHGVQEYSVEILKIYPKTNGNGRNLLIKVTDPALLEATGGIVQGMSGSPIIQDGKLIGAVTHVLVNDPTTGYGIFIENMLDAAA